MPSDPAPIVVTVRFPGRAPFRAVPLDVMASIIRIKRQQMTVSRDEMKAKRLKAMSVTGAQEQATVDMYDRIIAAGAVVEKARTIAEAAHMGALNEHLAMLKEDAQELADFAQAVPTPAPAAAPVKSSSGSDALAALQATMPSPRDWPTGDAYVGTRKEA